MNKEKTGLVDYESTNPHELDLSSIIPAGAITAINRAHGVATMAAKNALSYALECGRLLTDARERVPHGKWATWLSAQCPDISNRTDRLYRRLYEHRERIDSASNPIETIGEATRFLAEPIAKRHEHADLVSMGKPVENNVIKADRSEDIITGNQCNQCENTKWVLTDGGRVCDQCGAHEDDQLPMPETVPTNDIASDEMQSRYAKDFRAAKAAAGKLVRAIDQLGHRSRFSPLLDEILRNLSAVEKWTLTR